MLPKIRLWKNVACMLVVTAGLTGKPPAVSAFEPALGQIELFGFNFCPRGWLPARGQILAINQNQSLYSLFGTNYGGDGRTTFALPKLPVSEAGAPIYCVAVKGIFPSRS